ncbi:hypothetical protein Tco_1566250 [Tanacetum coccineum]
MGVDQLTKDPSSSGQKDLLSKAEGFILPNHDTGRILLAESQRNTIETDPSVVVTNSSANKYDSADESSVCSTPLPPLKKLDGVKINEPSSAPAKGNKSSSASKVNSAPVGKLKSVKIEDDPPIISLEREINPRNPQHSFKRCKTCNSSTHTTTDHYDIEWFKRSETLQSKKVEALKSTRAESSNANSSKTPTKR